MEARIDKIADNREKQYKKSQQTQQNWMSERNR